MRFLIQLMIVPQVLRLATRRSHTYLDAGTGSMIMQVVLGGTAGVAVLFKMFWRQISGVFHLGRRGSDDITAVDE
jgi:hypothetical protein